MIDHVSVAVRDLARAGTFYERVLGTLGYAKLAERPTTIGFGKRYPEFWINLRPDMPRDPDSGMHVALRAASVEAVDAFHAAALAAGATNDGPPGPRSYTNGAVYAAFVRDPDGNRLEVLTFTAVDGG